MSRKKFKKIDRIDILYYIISMIIYDFICNNEHVFEGWFKSSESMNQQLKNGLVTCPVCNSKKINVKPSAVGIITKKEQPVENKTKQSPYYFYKAIKDYLDKNFEDVGNKFAEEALKMHWNEIEKRNIKGTATDEEERELTEEGVQFFKINLPKFDA